MKKIIVVFSTLFISVMTLAHEFWLQPIKFLLGLNEKTSVEIYVGEGFKGEKSDGTKYTVQKLRHYSVSGNEDYTKHISSNDLSNIQASFSSAGNHLLAFNNSNKSIRLPAAEFNAYLREEGLNDVLLSRIQANDSTKEGRELYQRCAKTLLMVGGKSDTTFRINTGMRLEIIPRSNPYDIRKNDSLTFTILFDNKPVQNALVLAWQVVKGKTLVTRLRSTSEGLVGFRVNREGRWMISTVKMVPHNTRSEADWQSFWGSYTFGYY
jgi:uncharacterized GH25 family protein